ncbi:uncharacterized protein EI97DRAFT_431885 [Westerdykella ornata]|uniref:Uncharacterized protein n=1 Tax=Westerdykella ornata TaxID=318751 RepID=A0A6A6JMT7_WESOR|nr:uncharacterized protein EI97DRAFT_431885 [Westerdykella ornata]KAF2277812.1 hypothetical protein EI97DRAFT_431885 [Westerdykella ornata]
MSSKLVPSDPAKVMVIRDMVPGTITTLSAPFWRFGLIKIGGRGTVVRLQNGTLAVFSPIALTPEVKTKLSTLGEVKYITALDIEHHIYLGPWHQAFPNAKVLGPEGLPEKRKKNGNEDVAFSHIFSKSKPVESVDADFDREFEWEYVPAHTNKEIAFHHKPTRTLIQADLLFNLPATEQFSKAGVSATSGILTKLFGAAMNTKGNVQKRVIWYGISAGDRLGFAKSVANIDKWDFERIVPCHGDVIESGGKEVFRKVFAWHLDLAKKQT